MRTPTPAGERPLTPRQIRVLDELISVGAPRPTAPEGIAASLAQRLEAETARQLALWTEKSMYLTKSQILTALRCEGQLQANAAATKGVTSAAMLMGTIAHLAIQLSFTHPDRTAHEYVQQAVLSSRKTDKNLEEWWASASDAEQSALLVQATSRVTNFLDDFPPLREAWSPRFEEPIVAKAGRLTLSSRPDLVMGRPRGDGRQTMLLLDFKSGDLKDEHLTEAHLYALAATLRHGVPPWRSAVYSLASGEYTAPDVDDTVLNSTVDKVVAAVTSIAETLTDTRPAVLTAGSHCRYCPAQQTCPAASSE